MRKMYKPMERAQMNVETFNRKAINLTDDLEVSKDENGMENVADYWDKVKGMIGNDTIENLDRNISTNKSNIYDNGEYDDSTNDETLFNIPKIRKSIRGTNLVKNLSFEKELSDPENEEICVKNEGICVKKDDLKKNEKTKDDLKKNEKIKKPNFSKNEFEENINKENSFSKENSFNLQEPKLIKNSKETRDFIKEGTSVELESFDDLQILNHSIGFSPNKTDLEKKGSMKSKIFRKKIENPQKTSKKIESLKKTHYSKSVNVFDIKKVNKMSSLVNTKKINTGLLLMNYNSMIDGEIAEKSFSLYVEKGTVELTIDKHSEILKRGSISVVDSDKYYSMKVLSLTGARIIVTYAL